MIHNAEFVAWAKEEAARIERGEATRYHAVLCDPPYGLAFMGKDWDNPGGRRLRKNTDVPAGHGGDIASASFIRYDESLSGKSGYQDWTRRWASALIPLLYPGALVFCFGGTRTWHWLACGFEDAGFQIWDTLMWLHGQGFPKAQDISKLIDKANGEVRPVIGERLSPRRSGTVDLEKWRFRDGMIQETLAATVVSDPWSGHKTAALKPAWEPVLCFKAPTQGKTYAELAMEYGSGALNVDGGRIAGPMDGVWGTSNEGCAPAFNASPEQHDFRSAPHNAGRYPANLALECTCDTVEEVDAPDGVAVRHRSGGNTFGGDKAKPPLEDMYKGGKAIRHTDPNCPCFQLDAQAGEKPGFAGFKHAYSLGMKGYGCRVAGRIPAQSGFSDSGGPSRFFYCAKASRSERQVGLQSEIKNQKSKIGNDHPTIKPLSLCRWLATLLLPPDSIKLRRLLVPFAGTGSEIIGALQVGWDEVVGVEQDAHYYEIAAARTANAQAQLHLFKPKAEQLDLK